ncbi:helix-turn-helix transcriptional regulator [Georgenia sp. Z1344]|uniref:helix-turn-helix transcriptional regulator n=1 Tax=Georgenia sp. Z1344 TaxID=3416706 RepID=UPI003CEF2627
MTDPTRRALRLLDLLQARRSWTGAELAGELGVSPRTVRRDVERLRDLGYAVESTPGEEGGYRLQAGNALPPLLLDDEEALALAVGLRTAAVTGRGPEAAARTMAKIDQFLPSHLRRRAAALTDHVVEIGPGPRADATLLGELALGCRLGERVRFTYRDVQGTVSGRHVEPHTLVARHGRWYLVCSDLDRDAWRTFRLDRMTDARRTGATFRPRELPEGGIATLFRRDEPVQHRAEVTIEVGTDELMASFGRWIRRDAVEELGTHRVRWTIEAPSAVEILGHVLWLPPQWAWSIRCDEDVATALTAVRDRLSAVDVERW